MSTLIVPCLGRKFRGGRPQYLLQHPNGKLLLERSIEGVAPKSYSRIIVALLEEDVARYGADAAVRGAFEGLPLEVITLPTMTAGPAETVYRAIQAADVSGAVVVKDSDNYVKVPGKPEGNFVAGLDLNEWDRDVHNLRSKSFLILNEQKGILDIIEKKIKSDVICLGVYGFADAGDFIRAYERLDDDSYPIESLYVSHVISYLIGYYGRIFRYVAAEDYEHWGDDRLWREMQHDYALYFIDMDRLLGTNGLVAPEKAGRLRVLQDRGASFVGFTTRRSEAKEGLLGALDDVGIHAIDIVCGCPASEQHLVFGEDAAFGYRMAEL